MAVEQYCAIVFSNEGLGVGECWFGNFVFELKEYLVGGTGSIKIVLALLCGVECKLGVAEKLAYL